MSQHDEQLLFVPVRCRVRRRREEKGKAPWLHRDERRSRSRSPARNHDRHRESHRSESHRHASSSHRRDERRSTREEKAREPLSQLDQEEAAKQQREKENAELDEEASKRRRRIENWQVFTSALLASFTLYWSTRMPQKGALILSALPSVLALANLKPLSSGHSEAFASKGCVQLWIG